MPNQTRPTNAFHSSVPFDSSGARSIAVYCSDGRFADQCDDLLHQGLRLSNCDRMVLPGGPACLAASFSSYHEEQALLKQMRFLIRAHQLKRVILIAHHDCGFYKECLHISSERVVAQQCDDLRKAGSRIASLFDGVSVECYFAAQRTDGLIEFIAVP